MIVLPLDAPDDAILAVVRQWVDAVAAGESVRAATLLTETGNERQWPPDLVDDVISRYEAFGGTLPSRVTSPSAARRDPSYAPNADVVRWPRPRARPDVVGTVEFDLPINGVWSDLTAIFWLRRLPEGLALELYDIHVL